MRCTRVVIMVCDILLTTQNMMQKISYNHGFEWERKNIFSAIDDGMYNWEIPSKPNTAGNISMLLSGPIMIYQGF